MTAVLDTSGRQWEQRLRPKNGEQDAEVRAEVRLQLIEALFIESAVIPQLFQLLASGVAEFESAALLRTLLAHATGQQRLLTCLVEPLLSLFLPNVDVLCSILLGSGLKREALSAATSRPPLLKKELKLNAYTVTEPLGAFRVTAVQILAALSDLAAKRTVEALKMPIWTLLVKWFFTHRCNHIFQAACSKLFIAVIQHGSVRLQQQILVKLKLFKGICEIVLAEGAQGDRWESSELELLPQTEQPITLEEVSNGEHDSPTHLHENAQPKACAGKRVEKSRVVTRQKRHPGGLGSILPILDALINVKREANEEEARVEEAKRAENASREPLAPRNAPQEIENSDRAVAEERSVFKPTGHTPVYISKMLSNCTNWSQVVDATKRPLVAK